MEIKDVITIIIGLMTGGATVVLAIITWRYVRLTKDYVRLTRDILGENQRMRLDTQKPIIAIYLRSETTDYTFVYLCVENIGAGPAYGVEFDTDLSFRLDDTRSLGGEVPNPQTWSSLFSAWAKERIPSKLWIVYRAQGTNATPTQNCHYV